MKVFKRLMCAILAVLIITSLSANMFADSSRMEQIQVKCLSNLSDISYVNLVVYKATTYIDLEDVKLLSGYDEKQTTQKFIELIRSGKSVEIFVPLHYNDANWVPLESTMEKLDVSLQAVDGILVAYGKEHIAEELFEYTDDIILNKAGLYSVIDTHNFEGNIGLIGAFIYDVASSGGLINRITGKRSQDQYREIFSDIINVGSDTFVSLLKDVKKMNKYIKKLAELDISIEYDGASPEYLWRLGVSDTAVNAYMYTSSYDVILDPVGSFVNAILDTGELSELSISGLDYLTQMKLYMYIDSVVNCSEQTANMINYTYYPSNFINTTESLPKEAWNEVENIHSYFASDEWYDILKLYTLEEIKTVAYNTAGSLESALEKIIFDASSNIMISASRLALKTVYDSLFNASNKVSFAEKARLLDNLQSSLPELYYKYKKSNVTAINAKYTTLMYLTYGLLYYQLAEENKIIEDTGVLQSMLEKAIQGLLCYKDSDLTMLANNDIINVESLERIEIADFVTTGKSTYTGILRVEGLLSCFLELDTPIFYQDSLNNSTISTTKLWLTEDDVENLRQYNGLTVTLEGALFNYRGGGTIMFDDTPDIINVSGTPNIPAENSSYPNWDLATGENKFWDALEVLRTIIYRCDGVWDVRTLCDGVDFEQINDDFSDFYSVMLQINGSWMSDYEYEAYIAIGKDCIKISIGPNEDPSIPIWAYDWNGNLMSGSESLEEYIITEGLL